MLNRICIMPQKGCQGMKNARIEAAFKYIFSVKPVIVHTSLELKEKKVRRFAGKLGNFTQFKGDNNSYAFHL